MRLINVNTLKLEEFHHKIPPYAILSHTWDNDEVTFEMYQEYLDVTNRCRCPGTNARNSNIEMKAGFAKIMGACKRAREDKLGYLWCDTNCIDKSSSAELTEAINSMCAWYRDSAVCYAYIADVGVSNRLGVVMEEFRKSRWFTRGWTLQELLAPQEVFFFNSNWKIIGNRQRLANIICEVTRIHKGALENRDTVKDYSIAQRMSWVADRKTSRQEDIAYCLLGIFGINMPLLYGEGEKAFTRLQEEIIKVSDDESIFAWDFIGSQQRPLVGIFASSPNKFALCGSIVRHTSFVRSPYSMTNIGVSIELPLVRTFIDGTVLVGLNCSVELQEHRSCSETQNAKPICLHYPVWIWLRSIDHNVYARSSNPMSRTSLAVLYTDGSSDDTSIFGAVNTSRAASWVSSNPTLIRSEGVVKTGFHLVISFGRFEPRTGTYDETFPPGNFTIHQIPPKGVPALSHEIVSAGRYSVLLSIAWDHHHQPKCWRHAIFFGLDQTTLRMMSVDDWQFLFMTKQGPSVGRPNEGMRLEYIHDQVGKLLQPSTGIAEMGNAPSVHMEKKLWQDHHGQGKVLVHLTFQEATRPQAVS